MIILGTGRDRLTSHVVTIGKSIIIENSDLSIANLRARVAIDMEVEEIIAKRNGNLAEFLEKWTYIAGNV